MHVIFILVYILRDMYIITSSNIAMYSAYGVQNDETKIWADGDVIFGGLFPMHEKGKEGKNCGELKKEKGIQRLEAMLFAVKKINRDPKLLPGVKVGMHILDTCSYDTYALEQCMDFIKAQMTTIDLAEYKCENGRTPKYQRLKPVVGVIGAASSPVSIMVANILRLFKIPQISYASTSIDLSDKSRFEYFSRVVPPDSFQAQAMADIASYFGWNYVSTLADEGNYGEKGIGAFEEAARQSGVCISQSVRIPRVVTDADYQRILKELLNTPKARVVVMFVNEDNCRNILASMKQMNQTNELTFLASDSWGAKIHPVYGHEENAEGVVTILPKRSMVKEFDDYFLNLTSAHSRTNVWFKEYWETIFHCSFSPNWNQRQCTGDIYDGRKGVKKQIRKTAGIHMHTYGYRGFIILISQFLETLNPYFSLIVHLETCKLCIHSGAVYGTVNVGKERMADYGVLYEQEGLVQFVIDSVYALSHAIHHLLQDTCTGSFKSCLSRGQLSGEEVLKYIRNVSFTGISGDLVRFNEKGDGLGKYDIFQFQRITDSKFDYVKVGEWTDKLFINSSKLRWKDQSLVHPRSVCSESCQFGYAKNNTDETATCCWLCIKCGDNQYLFNEFTCKECPDGHKPNANVTGCVPLPVVHLDWDSLWVLLPASFSTAGIMSTCFVLYVFIRHNTTPIIMASGRELCYVLLTGIILAYTTSFVLLARPSVTLCTVKRFILGISLCLIYAAMLTKTNRIYRIFNTGIKVMVKRPGYTSPKSQIFICFSLVSVQIVGAITWLCFEKPETMYEQQHRDFLVLKCKASQIAILLSLMYNMFLIVLCTVFGFKTRKIPQNFNEAKYIAFTMYSTCIVWLAFIPIYFGANHDFKIETTSLCMCVSISASVALVCLFGPKVYIVIFQPHKNIRQAATPSLQTASRSFPRPYLPAQFSTTNCDSDRNSIAPSMNNANAKVDNITSMFSDSMEEGEEDEDEFGKDDEENENRPMEDKATSTDDINTL